MERKAIGRPESGTVGTHLEDLESPGESSDLVLEREDDRVPGVVRLLLGRLRTQQRTESISSEEGDLSGRQLRDKRTWVHSRAIYTRLVPSLGYRRFQATPTSGGRIIY